MTLKVKKITGWALTGVLALVFTGSASMKLFAGDSLAASSTAIGLSITAVTIIGLVELASIILFILPRTGLLGTLMLAAYLGGAIVTHLEHQQPFLVPVIIQVLVWITAIIRFPELTRRINGQPVAG
jgi:hypothetical protein